jgi:phospho-2-dehydro-3-deoxyheptonate aldolase
VSGLALALDIKTPQIDLQRTLLAAQTVLQGRFAVEKILRGDDDRLLVVVGYVTYFTISSVQLIFC